MKRAIDAPSGYLARLKGLYVRLFRMAHAIVGNLDLSEYVLRGAIVEAYLRRQEWQGRMGFQEGLEHTVRGVALAELKNMRAAGSFETDWVMPCCSIPEHVAAQTLLGRLGRESEDTQRIAMLYYGCALAPRQIAQVMRLRPNEINGRLRRLNSRLSRSLHLSGQRGRRVLEDQLEMLMNAALEQTGADVPEMGAVFRSFERDVDGAQRPRASAGRVVGAVLKVAGALVLAAAFWLLAVLLEPSVAMKPALAPGDAQTETSIAAQS